MPALLAVLSVTANVDARARGLVSPASVAAPTAATGVAAPPYAEARRIGSWVYVAGQIPRDPATGELRHAGDIRGQTRQVLDNLRAALATQGAGLADVVKVTVVLRSVIDMPAMNAIYRQYFDQLPLPARTTIPGADFGAAPILIEVDAVAFVAAICPGPDGRQKCDGPGRATESGQ
jgi:2-iminobutanoate/2-iminopropanoate deaminase